MDAKLKAGLWQQFGAAIDTLDDALTLCPDHLWTVTLWEDADDARYGQFWWVAYHALSWTDLFLTSTYKDFKPPAPFVRGEMPEQPYAKADIKNYLDHCRGVAQSIFANLTDEKAYEVRTFEWMAPTYFELQLYSMRHLQEHAAQMNLVLGHRGVTGQDWVASAREKQV
jgi:hypothetical protein